MTNKTQKPKETVVTLILPQDMSILEKAYSKVLAEIVCEMLTHEELGYLISELEKRENEEWKGWTK